jgi:uncharacterized protein
MHDGLFILDATVHAFNLHSSNVQDNRWARGLHQAFYDWHDQYATPDELLSYDVYMRDWSAEALTEVLFKESATDIGVHHVLRMDSWFTDGLVSFEKNLEIVDRWPQRFLVYLGIDPTDPGCLDDLRRQKDLIPSAIGLKIYPAQVNPYRAWRADDRERAFPIFELAQELGLKTVAFHKSLAVLGVPTAPYRIDDIEGAAMAFPDLNFEIVHAGTAYLEDTARAIGRFENVYANLEITSLLACAVPKLFDETMAALLYWGGIEKLLYATGSMEWHSQPIIETLADYQVPEVLREKFHLPLMTRDDKQKIFADNYANMVGLDLEALKRGIADDEFAQWQAANGGLAAGYSHWRARCAEDVGATA